MDQKEFKNNSLNFIRLITALKILFNHSIMFMKVQLPSIISNLLRCFPGVPIFFSVSGFLLWNSLDRDDEFKKYAKKRVLRLYPELWIGVILNAIIMIVLYREFINWKQFAIFQFAQGTIFQFWTPESLKYYGVGEPNGSLWTVGVMIQCYLFLFVAHKFLKNKSIHIWLLAIITGIFFNVVTPFLEFRLSYTSYRILYYSFIPYFWLFLLGAFIYEFKHKTISVLKKYWFILLIISAIVKLNISNYDLGIYGILENIPMVLGIIGFVYAVPNIKIKKDISYGIYVYHMIIVNIFVTLGYIYKLSYVIGVLVLTVVVAYVSYYVVNNKLFNKN